MQDIYVCDNCGKSAEYDDLPQAADLSQRLTCGGLYTDVECPDCGALCFPRLPYATKPLVEAMRNCLTDPKKLKSMTPTALITRLKTINTTVKRALKTQGLS